MTGITDVARVTGVSTATVSRALRGLPNVSAETRLAVRQAADALGYVPSSSAAGLASGRTKAMGVVVPTVSRWFYSTVLEGIDAVLRAASYDLILFNLGLRGHDRERVFHRSILRQRTDAVIALCLDFSSDEREQLQSTGHPVIVVGGPVRGLPHIGIDERKVGREATEHLISLGHRAIGHVGGINERGLNRRVPQLRERGYREALAALGVAPRPEWIVHGEFTIASSRAAARQILAGPERPTAIFATCDEMAIGTMLAAGDLGLSVPGDLSVIGIDDHELAPSFGLTTMAQDAYGQGALAARVMLATLDGRPVHKPRIATTLVERATTAPPR